MTDESLKNDILKSAVTDLTTDQLIDVASSLGMEINRRRALAIAEGAARSSLSQADAMRIASVGRTVAPLQFEWEDYCKIRQNIQLQQMKDLQQSRYAGDYPQIATLPPVEYRKLFGMRGAVAKQIPQ